MMPLYNLCSIKVDLPFLPNFVTGTQSDPPPPCYASDSLYRKLRLTRAIESNLHEQLVCNRKYNCTSAHKMIVNDH